MIGIDTNVLVRYFAEDDPAQTPLAVDFIERTLNDANKGFVSLVTLVELLWVLRSRFAARAAEINRTLMHLLSDGRFVVQDEDAAWRALDIHQRDGADIADALIAAVGRAHGCSHTVTFDAKAARIAGMRMLQTS